MEKDTITSLQIDLLKELANIGSGSAATALSQMLNETVLIDIPSVNICNLSQISEAFGDPEKRKSLAFIQIKDDLNGYILFILEIEDAKHIAKTAAGGYEMDYMLILPEITNIISGSYIRTIAEMINGKIDLTPPQVGEDMIGALTNEIVSSIISIANEVVVINTTLGIKQKTIPSYFVLLLDQDSLNKIFKHFGYNS